MKFYTKILLWLLSKCPDVEIESATDWFEFVPWLEHCYAFDGTVDQHGSFHGDDPPIGRFDEPR
jgi:hypothetical protein